MKHYGIAINEDNLELIKLINGGTLPEGINLEKEGVWKYFCFSIDERDEVQVFRNKVTVLKNPIRTWYSLWANDHHIKNDRILLG